jgi:hypothetical protein
MSSIWGNYDSMSMSCDRLQQQTVAAIDMRTQPPRAPVLPTASVTAGEI